MSPKDNLYQQLRSHLAYLQRSRCCAGNDGS